MKLLAFGAVLYVIGALWEFRIMRRRIERLERDLNNLYSTLLDSITTRIN